MKILLFSDVHFDAVTAGVSRFDEIRYACAAVVRAAIEQHVDMVCFLGDWCDPDSVCVHGAVRELVDMSLRLAHAGIPSRWLVGNHDVVEDGTGDSVLSVLRSLRMVCGEMVQLRDGPSTEMIANVLVMYLPYTSRAFAYDPVEYVQRIRAPTSLLLLVCSHLMIAGIGLGSETHVMARGRDVFLPLDALRDMHPNAVICNGHYHAPQEYRGVHVVGSLVRVRFDEAHNETGYTILAI